MLIDVSMLHIQSKFKEVVYYLFCSVLHLTKPSRDPILVLGYQNTHVCFLLDPSFSELKGLALLENLPRIFLALSFISTLGKFNFNTTKTGKHNIFRIFRQKLVLEVTTAIDLAT